MQAVVDDRDMSADRLMVIQLVENALRVDLAPLEAAAAYKALMGAWGCTQIELSRRLCISQSKISRTMSLLDLPAESKQALSRGELKPTKAMQGATRKRQRKPAKPAKSVQLRCPAGAAVITPTKGSSVVDVLTALLAQEQGRKAA